MKKYNLWWLKEHKVIGKIVHIRGKDGLLEGDGYWCGKCGEVNREVDYESERQTCKHCNGINILEELN